MRHVLKSLTVFALAALLVAPVWAADEAGKKKKEKGLDTAVARSFSLPDTITLTAEQKTKLDEVKKEFESKVKEVVKKQNDILTADQKKARAEAAKTAKAAGKKGKDLQADVDAALKLTDEQKKKTEEVGKELKALNAQIREKITSFLTDDQKAQLKPKKKKADKA